jgi:hypothetical protein
VKLVKEGHENDVAVCDYWRTEVPPEETFFVLKDNKPALKRVPLCEKWRSPRSNLPDRQFADLAASDNVWTNLLTYTTFPKRCDKRWTANVLKKVEELQEPLAADRFASLLRDLDDEKFNVREKATGELISAGVRARKQVEEALRHPLSAEVGQRLGQVLDTLKQEPSPQCKRVLAYLGNLETPEATEVLRILARGGVDPWLTKEARAALDRRAKKPDQHP